MNNKVSEKPIIFDYRSMPMYIDEMLKWRKAVEPNFSIRKVVADIDSMSPALVTQLRSGKRRLSRNHLNALEKLLNLNKREKQFFDQCLEVDTPNPRETSRVVVAKTRGHQNHLFSDWVHPYVKEAVRLKGFRNDGFSIYHILGGMISLPRIKKSLSFLLKEGFLRKNQNGNIVQNSEYDMSSDEVPNAKIRQFHKQALKIAGESLSTFPVSRREAYTLVLPLNQDNAAELKLLLKEFRDRLVTFVEQHDKDNGQLYQVVLNFCPLGGEEQNV